MPPRRGGRASGVNARRQNAQAKEKLTTYVDNIDRDTCHKWSFFPDTNKLQTMQEIPMPPVERWVQRDSSIELIRQRKSFELSWMTQRKIPIHAGYHNLRDLEGFAPPKWWANSGPGESATAFAVVEPEAVPQSVERAATITEAATKRAKGQTLAYTLEVNNNIPTPEYAAILKYGSVRALAEHTDCEG